jgi:hypothetical protein
VPYSVDLATGRLVPSLPSTCVAVGTAPGVPCRVRLDKWRRRKHGPEHPVAVGCCRPHRSWFTLYPPGWTPFARQQLAYETPLGDQVGGADVPWCGTLFRALVDEADGRKWPRFARFTPSADDEPSPPGTRKTQLRHLVGASMLLGLAAVGDGDSVVVAVALGIPLVQLAAAAAHIRDGPTAAVRGQGGAAVLKAVACPRRRLFTELVYLGHHQQFWGPPHTTP